MSIKIAINGFGRIGRIVFRQLVMSGGSDIEVVAINDLTDSKTLAHLLKYDSVHGILDAKITSSEGAITVNGREIKILAEREPKNLPWSSLGVDVVLECTGIFRSREKAGWHLDAGAKKVVVSAPSPDADVTLAFGVNDKDYNASEHQVLSCASCTTNCLAPVVKVLDENFGIVRGTMTTIHSYTNDQSILDLPHKDLRRARAAALSMIPTSTGAAKAVGLVLPSMKGKIDGMAIRVPTSNVSLVDFVAEVEKDVTVEEINRALRSASQNALKGIMQFCEEPLVSIDFVGNQHSSIVDSLSTMVIQKKLIKVLAWYDNEMGFSARMIDVSRLIGKDLK